MIDLHCHILPDLDDGAQSLRQAVEMAAMAAASGTTAIAATPHCAFDRRKEIYTSWQRLQRALEQENIPLQLLPGMEILGSADTAQLLRQSRLLTLNDSRYPLVEFSFGTDGQQETHILQQLLSAGYRPLVAHPERYAFLQEDPQLINLWARMGCLFQINRGSLLGRFGNGAQALAFSMLDRRFVTAVASDAHSSQFRTPCMQDVQQLLRTEFSPETATQLLETNPRRILQNKPLPPLRPEWYE